MSYEPTTWAAGDTVTSAKLNKMEQGIATVNNSNILFVNMIIEDAVNFTLDKTWKEIYEASQSGFVIAKESYYENETWRGTGFNQILNIECVENIYSVSIIMFYNVQPEILVLTTDSENGYPSGTIE